MVTIGEQEQINKQTTTNEYHRTIIRLRLTLTLKINVQKSNPLLQNHPVHCFLELLFLLLLLSQFSDLIKKDTCLYQHPHHGDPHPHLFIVRPKRILMHCTSNE